MKHAPRSYSIFAAFQQIFGFVAFLVTLWFVTSPPRSGPLERRYIRRRLPVSQGAYFVVVCQEEHLKSAMVLVHSLTNTHTKHDIVVLGYNVTGVSRQIFQALGAKVNPLPRLDGIVDPSSLNLPNRSSTCLHQKFAMWTFEQYKRVVYLDALMLIVENIDRLFDRPEPTAAPDNSLPDRFNPSVMVLRPHRATYQQLLEAYAQLGPELPEEREDVIMFNQFFSYWPQLGPAHHLEYFYNADAKLGYSATWNEWVHNNLTAVRFQGPFERWDDIVDKHFPPVRRYDHLRWLVLRDMHSQLVQQGVIPPSEHLANPLCHTDYMLYSRGAPVPRNMTVVIAAGGNLNVLQTLVVQFCAIRFIHSILVLPKVNIPGLNETLSAWNMSKSVTVLERTDFSMSQRMRPIANLATDCVLLCDDSVMVGSLILRSAFKAWQERPHRIVGFFPSSHYRDPYTNELVYVPDPRELYSMVSSRLLLMHSDYLQSYTCTLQQSVRDYVDKVPQCADIALNLLVAELTDSSPLLFVNSDKRVTEDVASSIEDHTRIGSACLNDLEAILGSMALRNSSEARMHLEQDTFTKVQFKGGSGSEQVADEVEIVNMTDPIFDYTGASSSDENYRFIPTMRRVNNMPEVVVFPSVVNPKKVLCIQGNYSTPLCMKGGVCNNTYAIPTYDAMPPKAIMLLGTSLVVHSRYGFDDRFHTPNIIANLFYPYPDYSFMRPARALFFKRGGLDSKLNSWARMLFKAVLGEHIAPFRVRSHNQPVCFERAVVTRRYRPAPHERSIVLQEVQERAWAYCSALKGESKEVKGFATGDQHTTRVLLLHGDENSGGGMGVIGNLADVVKALKGRCRRIKGCELVVMAESSFTNFCQQVLFMGAAHMFITVSGDSTMNHVIWMRSSMAVLELVPFGLLTYDPRVLRVYKEASKWVSLDHRQSVESTGPDCPTKNAACRFQYRKRAMVANTTDLLEWFNVVEKQIQDVKAADVNGAS